MPIGADQQSAERVMRVPKLHIGAVGRVTDVQRIKDQKRTKIARHDMAGQPPPAIFAHCRQIGQREPRRFPFAQRQKRRPDFNPVGVIGCVVPQPRAACGVDFASVTVPCVHIRSFKR